VTGYALSLESGPRRRTTMIHVLGLLGCVANGPTTEDALAATPDAIRAYRHLLSRHGEAVDLDDPIETHVVEHVTEGSWLGNGSPYITFAADFEPVTDEDIQTWLHRCQGLRAELAIWAATQTDETLDALPGGKGRPARAVLLHLIGATGSTLSWALGSAPGFGAVRGAAERGEVLLADALYRTGEMVAERVAATTPAERSAVRELSSGSYTLRKALRRVLEHDWEHLAELSRRPGGPAL